MADAIDAKTYSTVDGDDVFDVTLLQPASPVRCILFAAGRGGNPTRHLGLLQTLAAHGALIVAPHFQMLASPVPIKTELVERCQRLAFAMNMYCPSDISVSGVGHSIGTVVLLILAGATASTLMGDRLTFTTGRSLDRLALFTPPTDFFRRPDALARVQIPIQIWAGGKDTITPPVQANFLKEALADQTHIEIILAEEAGHFTFMNELPPNVTDPHPERTAFLQSLAEDVNRFLAA
jgi:fermentation-respiration switch protein FrsA (DUF1100 family)